MTILLNLLKYDLPLNISVVVCKVYQAMKKARTAFLPSKIILWNDYGCGISFCVMWNSIDFYIPSKIIFSEKSLSVHMSVRPSPSRPPKKLLKLKTLLSKVVRYTLGMLLPPPLLHCWARRSRATYIQHNLEFHHLSRVGPKQLCALAHLESTRAAGTS